MSAFGRSSIWVDPRMRGGAPKVCHPFTRCLGRSPHARGSPRSIFFLASRPGSIPACAGEPNLRGLLEPRNWVDPRMRGGAAPDGRSVGLAEGRSPHARGSLGHLLEPLELQGSIPACAGEPSSTVCWLVATGVDPRMRGGATVPFVVIFCNPGRSPHARGSRISLLTASPRLGSIPACAGEP